MCSQTSALLNCHSCSLCRSSHLCLLSLIFSVCSCYSPGWALASALCYASLGPELLCNLFAVPVPYSAALAGLCIIGLLGFLLMAFFEGGPDLRDPCGQGGCCALDCCCCDECARGGAWDAPATAEGCLALIAALLIVVVSQFSQCVRQLHLIVCSVIHKLRAQSHCC
jgi:hypothetical protein